MKAVLVVTLPLTRVSPAPVTVQVRAALIRSAVTLPTVSVLPATMLLIVLRLLAEACRACVPVRLRL